MSPGAVAWLGVGVNVTFGSWTVALHDVSFSVGMGIASSITWKMMNYLYVWMRSDPSSANIDLGVIAIS